MINVLIPNVGRRGYMVDYIRVFHVLMGKSLYQIAIRQLVDYMETMMVFLFFRSRLIMRRSILMNY